MPATVGELVVPNSTQTLRLAARVEPPPIIAAPVPNTPPPLPGLVRPVPIRKPLDAAVADVLPQTTTGLVQVLPAPAISEKLVIVLVETEIWQM